MKRVSSINHFFRKGRDKDKNKKDDQDSGESSPGTPPPPPPSALEQQQQHQGSNNDECNNDSMTTTTTSQSLISSPPITTSTSNLTTAIGPIPTEIHPLQQQQQQNESPPLHSISSSSSNHSSINNYSNMIVSNHHQQQNGAGIIKSALIISTETVSPDRKPYTVYKIQVEMSNQTVYNIIRRYSEFLDLDLKLHSKYPLARLPFPPKKTFGKMNNEFIVQRREHLQLFMNAVFEHEALPTDSLVQDFFAQRTDEMRSLHNHHNHHHQHPNTNNSHLSNSTNQVIRYIISTLPFWSDYLDYESLLSLTETCNYLYNTVSYYSDVWKELYWRHHSILHWGSPKPVVCICTVELHKYHTERSRGIKRDMSTANLNHLLTSSPTTLSNLVGAFEEDSNSQCSTASSSLNSSTSAITTTTSTSTTTTNISIQHNNNTTKDHPVNSYTSDNSNTSPSTSPSSNFKGGKTTQNASNPASGSTRSNETKLDSMEYSRQVFLQLLAAHSLLRTSLETHLIQSYCDCLVPKFKGCIIGPPNLSQSFLLSFRTTFSSNQTTTTNTASNSTNSSNPTSPSIVPTSSSSSLSEQDNNNNHNNNNNLDTSSSTTTTTSPLNISTSSSSASSSITNNMDSLNINDNSTITTTTTTTQKHIISHIVSNNRMFCVGITDTSNDEKKEEQRYNLSQCHFVMITFSLIDRSTFDMVDKWAEDVKLMCPEAPVILVGLQRDQRDASNTTTSISYQDGHEKSKLLYNCVGYIESPSASDGVGGYRRSVLTEMASNLYNHYRPLFTQPTKRSNYEIKISFLLKIFPRYIDDIVFRALSSYEGDVEKAIELLAMDYANYIKSEGGEGEGGQSSLRNSRSRESNHSRSQSHDYSRQNSWSLKSSWNQEISKMDKEQRDQIIDGYLNLDRSSSSTPNNNGNSSSQNYSRRSIALSSSSVELQINQLVEKLKKSSVDSFIKAFLKKKNLNQDQQAEMVLSFLREMKIQLLSSQLFNNAQNSEEDLTGPPASEIENYLYQSIYKSVFSTSESLQKDVILSDRMSKLVFVEPQHLEIRRDHWNKDLWAAAEKELHSVNDLYSPSQKLECILNCCKIILFLLSNSDSPGGADDFLPHLIYVVIHANIPNLYSNFEFTSKFCNTELLKMERYYYFTTFGIAVTFIENIDAKHLKIDSDEYHAYMSGKKKYIKPSEDDYIEPINEDPPTLGEVSRAKIMQKLGIDNETASRIISMSPKKGSLRDSNEEIEKLVQRNSHSEDIPNSSSFKSGGDTPTQHNPFNDVSELDSPLLPAAAWTHSSTPPPNNNGEIKRNSFKSHLSRTPPPLSSTMVCADSTCSSLESTHVEEHPLSASKPKTRRDSSVLEESDDYSIDEQNNNIKNLSSSTLKLQFDANDTGDKDDPLMG